MRYLLDMSIISDVMRSSKGKFAARISDIAYAHQRVKLEAAGTPIGGNDLLIAAHSLALDATLVTGNAREFARIKGLSVENWLR